MITFQQATTKDIDLLRHIAEKTWFVTYRDMLSQEQMDYMFDMMYSPESINKQMTVLNHVFYLAFQDEKPLGYVSVEQQEETLFHLHKLYIMPEGQGKGLGRKLMEKAYHFAKEHSNGKECALELNMNRDNPALHFYEKMGMHISARGDFEIGNGYYMNDYILRIDLK
ncbi:MAG: GNAT family N-acetyltransferase [Bacteroidales bacterium]|nr:GNAT family N-acetyltransferase [Bacteroidales bacterium]